MIKIATFIVDRRNLFYLLFILGLVFCMFSMNWTVVEDDLSYYLDDSTETKQALEVMNEVLFSHKEIFTKNNRGRNRNRPRFCYV